MTSSVSYPDFLHMNSKLFQALFKAYQLDFPVHLPLLSLVQLMKPGKPSISSVSHCCFLPLCKMLSSSWMSVPSPFPSYWNPLVTVFSRRLCPPQGSQQMHYKLSQVIFFLTKESYCSWQVLKTYVPSSDVRMHIRINIRVHTLW